MSLINQPMFLCFATVEGLVEEIESAEHRGPDFGTVYVLPVNRLDGGQIGSSRRSILVQARLADGIGTVQIPTGRSDTLHGRAMDDQADRRVHQATSDALAIVTRWLDERGLKVVEACFARPKDYVFVDGAAEFLRYDPEAKTFVPTKEESREDEP